MTVEGSSSLDAELRAGAEALGLQLADRQVTQLLDYLGLLQKWNKVYNLTAVRDPREMLTQHLLDSLAVVPHLRKHTGARPAQMLDVGSGGGLPGVVLAVCMPELQVDCVDAVGKKAAFIQQSAAQLGLPNLRGVHSRVEQVAQRYDVVCSRAFASLVDFVSWSATSLADGGVWLAMKGKLPEEEMATLPAGVEVFHVEHLSVPGLDAERCLLWLRPRAQSATGAAQAGR